MEELSYEPLSLIYGEMVIRSWEMSTTPRRAPCPSYPAPPAPRTCPAKTLLPNNELRIDGLLTAYAQLNNRCYDQVLIYHSLILMSGDVVVISNMRVMLNSEGWGISVVGPTFTCLATPLDPPM